MPSGVYVRKPSKLRDETIARNFAKARTSEIQRKNGEKISASLKARYGDRAWILSEVKLVRWAKAIKKRDNYTCRRCGITQDEYLAKVGQNIQSHHIKPKETFPELAYNLDNGLTLCGTCHGKVHFGGKSISIPLENKWG
jgi:5-methylcytosine-specific restriction endonuclease McrA